ncbi:MAG: dihydropteroate synthase [Gammaproteobacteria bacterium]|nr:dihydropteroate synthase [Gammaproteobacteria bacterium]MBQ0840005.1 dihydropteroate synthase [Gammaproteobacteria bacterium]
MGIVNLTPDSFSDGGDLYRGDQLDLDAVLYRAQQLIDEGADLLDIGGESTRPGADKVELATELARVLPVLEALRGRFDIPLSVDTSSPELMVEAASGGAAMLNDVRALCRPGALAAAAASSLPICLMHTLGEPQVMQGNPRYRDVVAQVTAFLRERIEACGEAGIARSRLVLDPGFGFGKTLEQNLSLFRALPAFVAEGLPVMVGVSRKSLIGAILDKPVEQRVYGSAALAVLAAQSGVGIIRVHDVAATVDSLKMLEALQPE